jgi:hypothetical protein
MIKGDGDGRLEHMIDSKSLIALPEGLAEMPPGPMPIPLS